MSGPLWLRSLIMIFTLFWGAFSYGAPTCSDVFIKYPEGGAAIELEMSLGEGLMKVLTTHEGQVGSLFSAQITNAKMPLSFQKWAQDFYPDINPEKIEWELIPHPFKMDLIKAVTAGKKTGFFADRRVPGIKVKETISVNFEQDSRFLGKLYEAGRHEIDVADIFRQVEYRGPSDIKRLKGLELHMRSSEQTAGELLKDAWKFQSGIGARKTYMHAHVVVKAPIPTDREAALNISEYYRRSNLLAELMTVAELGFLHSNKAFNWSSLSVTTFFDTARPRFFSGVYRQFIHGPENNGDLSPYKMGFVGFRDHRTYDQENVFGFEYRAIDRKGDETLHGKVLDNLQYGLRTQRYGFTYEHMAEWMADKKMDIRDDFQVERALESAWYQQSYNQLYRRLPKEFKAALGGGAQAFFTVYALKVSDLGNHALKMLLYDWSADPIYFKDSAAQQKIREVQKKVLSTLLHDSAIADPQQILRTFVRDSGLLEQVGKSFNLSKSDLEPSLKATPLEKDSSLPSIPRQ